MIVNEFEECHCERFSQLEGKAAEAHIFQFLEICGSGANDNQAYYCCRACGQPWIKTESELPAVFLLIKQKTEYDV